jgi:prepilin-type N-terminal cleavage/methylation domain-containing protein
LTRARRGFSIAELLITLGILSVIGLIVSRLMLGQQRFFQRTNEQMELRRELRSAMSLVPADLRSISSSGGDLTSYSASAIQFRAVIGASIVCQRNSATQVSLPPLDMARNTLTSWYSRPEVGDTMWVFNDSLSRGAEDDEWKALRITDVSESSTDCAASPYIDATLDAAKPRFRITVNAPVGAHINPGSAIRFTRSTRYFLDDAASGKWYLHREEYTSGEWSPPVAVSGPYAAPAPNGAGGPAAPRQRRQQLRQLRRSLHREHRLARLPHRPEEPAMTEPRLLHHHTGLDQASISDTVPAHRRHRPRRGMALVLTLIVVVVLAILSTGAVISSMQEYRGGRNALVEQRAFAVAEFGLNSEISNWNRGRNLPPPRGMLIGAIDSANVFVAQGDTAKVYIQRLTDNTFWVRSVGRASIGNAQLESQRMTNMVVRTAYPTIEPNGAIVTAGNVRVSGSAVITGQNTNPANWAQCANIPGNNVFGITHAPGRTVSISGASTVIGGTNADPAAADSNTYVRYGTESWNSLVSAADVKLAGGSYGPEPVGTSSTCNMTATMNWGEPLRGGNGHVRGCEDFFPIIYINGTATLTRGRGQGILLVNGDVRTVGNFQWYGLIIARDDIVKGAGTFDLWGSAMSRNANVNDDNTVVGNSNFQWSRCAVESALRGSAILTRTKERSWAQLY